ncbi:MAG: hypothetical protein GPJ50_03840 [Candidatus Heimdallarchaeota archaeon]|nr:hypothetical protein [Candidatus Heimdallarchaeota archaeon]
MIIRNENGLAKWVKTTINFESFKELKKLAVDEDTSLAELLREATEKLLRERKQGGEKIEKIRI